AMRLDADSPTTITDTLREPVVLGGMLVLVAAVVMAPVVMLRRSPASPSPRGIPPAERAPHQPALEEPVAAGPAAGTPVLRAIGTPVALRYRDNALPPEGARLRADRSERGLVMRFGSRRDDEPRSAPTSPASRSVAEVSEQPVLPSKRLQRLAEHFRSQGDLLATMRD